MNENSPAIDEVVAESVSDTFGNMAFMDVRPLRRFCARVSVLAPFRGGVTVALPEEMASAMAATITNVPREQQTDEMLLDLVSELANTLAGCLLSRRVAPSVAFELDVPEKSTEMISPREPGARFFNYATDEHCFLVVVEGAELLSPA